MINFVVTQAHQYTLNSYIQEFAEELRSQFRVFHYETLGQGDIFPRGTWIFADLERATIPQVRVAAYIAQAAQASGQLVLNNPSKAIFKRRPLLYKMWTEGINDFRFYRADEKPERYPVFIRVADDHKGASSDLIDNQQQLEATLKAMLATGVDANDLIIQEYRHTADSNGLYRKYSFMITGNHLFPRHIYFGKKWVIKYQGLVTEETVREEEAFLFSDPHPHRDEIKKIFELAGITYGRVDYAVVDGKILVWEINTNPMIMSLIRQTSPLRLSSQSKQAELQLAAFKELIALAPKKSAGTVTAVRPQTVSTPHN